MPRCLEDCEFVAVKASTFRKAGSLRCPISNCSNDFEHMGGRNHERQVYGKQTWLAEKIPVDERERVLYNYIFSFH